MTPTTPPTRTDRTPEAGSVAAGLGAVLLPLFGGTLPLRLRAWDGSSVGPEDAPTVVVKDPAALRRLVFAPGELGLAQAYVTGRSTSRAISSTASAGCGRPPASRAPRRGSTPPR